MKEGLTAPPFSGVFEEGGFGGGISRLKLKMYTGHVESNFVLQNSRWWQDI
jgi:hypothetical protein